MDGLLKQLWVTVSHHHQRAAMVVESHQFFAIVDDLPFPKK